MTRFVVALGSEARPLVEHFGLSPRETCQGHRGSFRWFRSDSASLVVSGTGKTAAAAATAYLHAKTFEEPYAVWLNVGIAGHRARAPGELVRAHTISDAASGERFFPTLLGATHLDTAGVTTVDVAETAFLTDDVYDMEASGFYKTALRFSTIELVQSLKIVSDNQETGMDSLTKERVSELVSSGLEPIDQLVSHLRDIAAELAPLRVRPESLDAFRSAWRFTTTESRHLVRLLARCRVLDPTNALTPETFEESWTARDVLRELERHVRSLALKQQGF